MISEHQIDFLLLECESALGRRLEELRKRLLRHSNYNSTIWELVTLYVALRQFDNIDHEGWNAGHHPKTVLANCVFDGSHDRRIATCRASRSQ